LAKAAPPRQRTALFARYSKIASLVGALGALAAGAPDALQDRAGVDALTGFRAMFVGYGCLGVFAGLLYSRLPRRGRIGPSVRRVPLGPSRRIVVGLTALFGLDAFAGGFVVQSLVALWLLERHGLSLATTAAVFAWSGALTAISYRIAAAVARRFGLINTMVFSHLPANLCLMLLPLAPSLTVVIALLTVRALLSQMDVPTRSSYVMAVVTPEERPAASSLTSMPRSLAAALGPAMSGYLLALSSFGWPLIIGGVLKIVYDLLLLAAFRNVRPPEKR